MCLCTDALAEGALKVRSPGRSAQENGVCGGKHADCINSEHDVQIKLLAGFICVGVCVLVWDWWVGEGWLRG